MKSSNAKCQHVQKIHELVRIIRERKTRKKNSKNAQNSHVNCSFTVDKDIPENSRGKFADPEKKQSYQLELAPEFTLLERVSLGAFAT